MTPDKLGVLLDMLAESEPEWAVAAWSKLPEPIRVAIVAMIPATLADPDGG